MCPGTAIVGYAVTLGEGHSGSHSIYLEGKVNKLSREYGQRGGKNEYFNNI